MRVNRHDVAAISVAFFSRWQQSLLTGMATPDHTPHGRGYQSELLYFGHANDYWTSGEGASGCLKPKPTRVVDLWNLSPDAPEGTAEGGARTQVAQCNFTELGDWSMQKVTGDRCVPGADGDHW